MELRNPIPLDDAEAWLSAVVVTMFGDPHDDEFPRRLDRWRREWDPERTWGVRDGGQWVATLATDPKRLTVPGPAGGTVDLAGDGVTAVTTAATHRRRGLLTQMITSSLAAAKDRGDPYSVLLAAEWPIYGRFGYAPAGGYADYTLASSPRTAPAVTAGTMRHVQPAELGPHAQSIFEASRRSRPGQTERSPVWWHRRLGLDGYEIMNGPRSWNWAMHEGSDGPDGFVAWKSSRDIDLNGRLGAIEVHDLVAATDSAYRDLCGYLAGIDGVAEITLASRPVDEPLRWLLSDGRLLRQTYAGDDLWLRLLDVPVMLSTRGYATPGEFVLDVVDTAPGGYAAGTYLLEADASGARCTPTTRSAEIRLTQQALASSYLGRTSLRALTIARTVEELVPGAVARADAMLATPLAPWNATGF